MGALMGPLRLLSILALGAAWPPGPAHAGDPVYEWTLSSSFVDPFANEGPAARGARTLYLWFRSPTADGMSAAEFRLATPAGASSLLLTTHNGFTNSGGPLDLVLEVHTCPAGPVVAASWLVMDTPAGGLGDYCLEPTLSGGILGTRDCLGTLWPQTSVCFRSGDEPPPPGVHWSLSLSSTDPDVNLVSEYGDNILRPYLWFRGLPEGAGISAAEFALSMPPGIVPFGFSPLNGFMNAGTELQCLLAVGGCPSGPVAAGWWTLYDPVGHHTGTYALVPSSGGFAVSMGCESTPTVYPLEHTPLVIGSVSVEPTTWARIKTGFR